MALICVECLTCCLVRTVFTLFLTLTLFLKGIVDSKMKNLSWFTLHHVVPNMTFFLSWRKRPTFTFLFTVCLASAVAFKSFAHVRNEKKKKERRFGTTSEWIMAECVSVVSELFLTTKGHFPFLTCLNSFGFLRNKRLTHKAVLIYSVSGHLVRSAYSWTTSAFW